MTFIKIVRSPNAFDYEAIRNTIAKYAYALDTKDWELFPEIFVSDVDAHYSFSNEAIVGWRDIARVVEDRSERNDPARAQRYVLKVLAHVTTQHALTTQSIVIAEDGKSARATTYFTGIHFGQGKWKGQEVTAWGKYVDTIVIVNGKQDLPGASGRWRINTRAVGFHGVGW